MKKIPKLSDFYHPSEGPKNGELLFVTLGAGLATYTLYKSSVNDRQETK